MFRLQEIEAIRTWDFSLCSWGVHTGK